MVADVPSASNGLTVSVTGGVVSTPPSFSSSAMSGAFSDSWSESAGGFSFSFCEFSIGMKNK